MVVHVIDFALLSVAANDMSQPFSYYRLFMCA